MVRQSHSTFWLECCKVTHLLYTSSSLPLTTLFLKALSGKEEELRCPYIQRNSSRIGPARFIDVNFADIIALTSKNFNQAQTMLERVEKSAVEIGLKTNPKKTKIMVFHTPRCKGRNKDE